MKKLYRDRILTLADHIETVGDKRFHMRAWFSRTDKAGRRYVVHPEDFKPDACGSAACVAGWAAHLSGRLDGMTKLAPWLHDTAGVARDWLGIDGIGGIHLFMPMGHDRYPEDFTAKRAGAVLRHLARNGTVRWELYDQDGNRKGKRNGTDG